MSSKEEIELQKGFFQKRAMKKGFKSSLVFLSLFKALACTPSPATTHKVETFSHLDKPTKDLIIHLEKGNPKDYKNMVSEITKAERLLERIYVMKRFHEDDLLTHLDNIDNMIDYFQKHDKFKFDEIVRALKQTKILLTSSAAKKAEDLSRAVKSKAKKMLGNKVRVNKSFREIGEISETYVRSWQSQVETQIKEDRLKAIELIKVLKSLGLTGTYFGARINTATWYLSLVDRLLKPTTYDNLEKTLKSMKSL